MQTFGECVKISIDTYVNTSCFVLATCSIIETTMSTSKTALFAFQCTRQRSTHTDRQTEGWREISRSAKKYSACKNISTTNRHKTHTHAHTQRERKREGEGEKVCLVWRSKKLKNFLIKTTWATAKGQHRQHAGKHNCKLQVKKKNQKANFPIRKEPETNHKYATTSHRIAAEPETDSPHNQ